MTLGLPAADTGAHCCRSVWPHSDALFLFAFGIHSNRIYLKFVCECNKKYHTHFLQQLTEFRYTTLLFYNYSYKFLKYDLIHLFVSNLLTRVFV